MNQLGRLAAAAVGTDAVAPMVVHIGYPRTASSFLQTQVFRSLPNNVPARHYDTLPETGAALREQTNGVRSAIYSNEHLSGGIDGDHVEYAGVVQQAWPGARIIIVIRSQYSIFRSYYHLATKGGATKTFPDFVKARLHRMFLYRAMVERYWELFGADQVKVLLYEDLSRDPQAFLHEVIAFTGNDPALSGDVRLGKIKTSATDIGMRILRWRNLALTPVARLFPDLVVRLQTAGLPGLGLVERLAGGMPLAKLPLDELRPIIREAYAHDNAVLFARLGRRIADYDYPQP